MHSVYCRTLEDSSGFGVFRRVYKCSRWEVCLGVGATRASAWADYRERTDLRRDKRA